MAEDTSTLPDVGLPEGYYLLGDIGGTNIRLELRDAHNTLLHRRDKLTHAFRSFNEAMEDFLSHCSVTDTSNILMCVCYAGKVMNNHIVACSNIKWPLTSGEDIKRQFSR